MDELLSEQIEWVVSCNTTGNRLAHHLLVIVGCLADNELPEHINHQMLSLSRQVKLQGVFDTLVNSFDQYAKSTSSREHGFQVSSDRVGIDVNGLMQQIDESRQQLMQSDTVNYGELIAWICGKARERKIWNKGKRR